MATLVVNGGKGIITNRHQGRRHRTFERWVGHWCRHDRRS
jgi:hypothetical protein